MLAHVYKNVHSSLFVIGKLLKHPKYSSPVERVNDCGALYSGVEYVLTAVSAGDLPTAPDVQDPRRQNRTNRASHSQTPAVGPRGHIANTRKYTVYF